MKKNKRKRKKLRTALRRKANLPVVLRTREKRKKEREQKDKFDRLAEVVFSQHKQTRARSLEQGFELVPGLKQVGDLAPRLLDERFRNAISRVLTCDPVRPLETWKPKGKSPHRLFAGMVDHLLVNYRIPRFLYDAFFEEQPELQTFGTELCAHLGRGKSLYDFVRKNTSLPLTRKMCHLFLDSPTEIDLVGAIRRAQTLGHGGNEKLARAIAFQRPFNGLLDEKEEVFWDGVLHWFCRQELLQVENVRPILDWIDAVRGEPQFSMKGRTLLSALRAVDEWHWTLAAEQFAGTEMFPWSGLSPWILERQILKEDWQGEDSLEDHVHIELHRIREIVTIKDLFNEGRAMSHCVYQYAQLIRKRESSIWSYTRDNKRVLTLEVRKQKVAQIRGRANRVATASELSFVRQWMRENNLRLGGGASC